VNPNRIQIAIGNPGSQELGPVAERIKQRISIDQKTILSFDVGGCA
jgi:hypothetical protein